MKNEKSINTSRHVCGAARGPYPASFHTYTRANTHNTKACISFVKQVPTFFLFAESAAFLSAVTPARPRVRDVAARDRLHRFSTKPYASAWRGKGALA